MADSVVIVTGAAAIPPAVVAALPGDALVIAADGGLDHALAAGLHPTVVVGDFDSISPGGMAWARANAVIDEHPADKAATDTELALDHALGMLPRRLILVGADDGSRLDHAISTIGVLGRPELADVVVEGWWGTARLSVVHGGHRVRLSITPGTVFSVLALHGPVHGVVVTGARWPLDGVTLPALSGWGMSNEATERTVTVGSADGVLTVVIPGGSP
jgi:thiamine pyrophosphokinase